MLLFACSRKPVFKGMDISGASMTMTAAMTDHNGRRRTLADFRGKVIALFFGYTHCPDECPATMAQLARAMQLLGKQADQVQVLFVTADPARDTLPVLAKWLTGFDPRFLGLRGTPDELRAAASQMKVVAGPSGKSGDETIMHNGNVFLFDRNGAVRVLEDSGVDARTLAADMRQLLE
ncbi:MAG: SCO family protein [Paraburkholderia sp.]|nr:MAG: SCO family protein [Paraburkholderia sp.]